MNFKHEELDNLRIHELRDLARHIGVKSPTSKKKEELIQDIELIVSGKSQPYINETKQGRPVKSTNTVMVDGMVDYFIPKETMSFDLTGNYDLNANEMYDFFANSPKAGYNSNHEAREKLTGILDIHQNGYGILRLAGFCPSPQDAFVNIYDIKKHNLMSGDTITGEFALFSNSKSKGMVNLIAVNGNLVEYNQSITRYEKLEYSEPKEKLIINSETSKLHQFINHNATIDVGGRLLLLHENNVPYKNVMDFARNISKDYIVYVINLNAKPEEKSFVFENVHVESVMFNMPENVQMSVANLVIEKAKRDVENNKKVVVILNKISVLIKAVNNVGSSEYLSDISMSTVHRIKEFLMCAKYVNENQNLSLIVFDTMLEKQSVKDFILHDLGDLFNNIIAVSIDQKPSLRIEFK